MVSVSYVMEQPLACVIQLNDLCEMTVLQILMIQQKKVTKSQKGKDHTSNSENVA